ncbi:MAG: SUMF1/EgtB/PvdO family nonheme iron enzyme [Candidatus Cloacimonetes bacterium]|nr:SUMF1/EgtB/PvdO family nonheme iron enzyme [Candidatus Cloacimonadota bacterium]
MKKFKDIAIIIFALSLSILLLSCGEKTTEPKETKVATPTFSPRTGTYEGTQYVTIKCATKGAAILYTTDGSAPGVASPVYSEPIMIDSDTTIIAQAFKAGLIDSDISSVSYIINMPTVATPVFNPAGGVVDSPQSVLISCATAGAVIRYTTNGISPTSSSTLYEGAIQINPNTMLKARAFKEDWNDSDIATANFLSPTEMVLVPAGTFTMGRTQGSGESNELPTHSVTLSSFSIGKYQVTQSEYQAVMGSNPALDYGVGSNYPVYFINWYDAITYCNLRSIIEGLTPVYSISDSTNPDDWGIVPYWYDATWDAAVCNWNANGYRLPTEAEWEYAARGAANSPDYLYSGSDIVDDVAWYCDNSDGIAHPVGGKSANGLGIYDMSGNVYELCWDRYDRSYYSSSPSDNPSGPESGSYRVLRGGSWVNYGDRCRVAYRGYFAPSNKDNYVGFRVCRTAN